MQLDALRTHGVPPQVTGGVGPVESPGRQCPLHHPHDEMATQPAQSILRAQGSLPPSGGIAAQITSAVCASSQPAK